MSNRNILRRITFRPYREGMGPVFRLITWDTGWTDCDGRTRIGYRLLMRNPGVDGVKQRAVKLFEGEDFCCSLLHSIDGKRCVASLMAFLTLRPGDTDREYFASYT